MTVAIACPTTKAVPAGIESGIPLIFGRVGSWGVIRSTGSAMPKACSADLRERVLAAVEEGATRREAAERFEVSPSSAVKWFQAWEREGRRTAKPRGGSRSPLEDHADEFLQRPVRMLADQSQDLVRMVLRSAPAAGLGRPAALPFPRL